MARGLLQMGKHLRLMPTFSRSRRPGFFTFSGTLLLAAVALGPIGAAEAAVLGARTPNNLARSVAGARLALFGPTGGRPSDGVCARARPF